MELTSGDVHNKQFHDQWRGYNQGEVDDFLDKIAERIDRLGRENESLKARIAELDQQVAAARDTEEMLKKTLLTAQQAAEEAIARAKAKAEEIVSTAEARVQVVEQESTRKAQESERQVAERTRSLDERIERLKTFETDTKSRLRQFFEQQLKALDALSEVEEPRLQAQQRAQPAARPSATPAPTPAPAREQQAPQQQRPAGTQETQEPNPQAEPGEGLVPSDTDTFPAASDEEEPSRRGVRDLFFRQQ